MTQRTERELVVAFLREPVKGRAPWWTRPLLALAMLVWPNKIFDSVTRLLAKEIERGDHLKGTPYGNPPD